MGLLHTSAGLAVSGHKAGATLQHSHVHLICWKSSMLSAMSSGACAGADPGPLPLPLLLTPPTAPPCRHTMSLRQSGSELLVQLLCYTRVFYKGRRRSLCPAYLHWRQMPCKGRVGASQSRPDRLLCSLACAVCTAALTSRECSQADSPEASTHRQIVLCSPAQHLRQPCSADLLHLSPDQKSVIQGVQLLAFWELVGGTHLQGLTRSGGTLKTATQVSDNHGKVRTAGCHYHQQPYTIKLIMSFAWVHFSGQARQVPC